MSRDGILNVPVDGASAWVRCAAQMNTQREGVAASGQSEMAASRQMLSAAPPRPLGQPRSTKDR